MKGSTVTTNRRKLKEETKSQSSSSRVSTDIFRIQRCNSTIEKNIYTPLTSNKEVFRVLEPLLLMSTISAKQSIYNKNIDLGEQIKHGNYKKRIKVEFEYFFIDELRLPSQKTFEEINTRFDIFLLAIKKYSRGNCIELLIKHRNYISTFVFDKAVRRVIVNMAGGSNNLGGIHFDRACGSYSDQALVEQVLSNALYQPANIIVNYNSNLQGRCQEFGVIVNEKGNIINIEKLIGEFLVTLSHIMCFTSNATVRGLQNAVSAEEKQGMMRVIDHRPILFTLWCEAVRQTLSQEKIGKELKQRFTNEQIGLIYNTHQAQIAEHFNRYVLGGQVVIQPHPVRALLDRVQCLQGRACSELLYYDLKQYGLNLLLVGHYIAKNMLQRDESLSNDRGCCALVGTQGSGKSRILQILDLFFNGFKYMDSNNGIFEFQNYDIVTKSFIQADEVIADRLTSSGWKQLADLTAPIKCRIKNKPDVEVKKNVTVFITGNFDPHEELIKKLQSGDLNVGAACRRWGFVRFYQTWEDSHSQIINEGARTIDDTYRELYQSRQADCEFFNMLIAIALLNQEMDFFFSPYILQYYKHCLQQFSGTLFGQVMLLHNQEVAEIIAQLRSVYQTQTDLECQSRQRQLAKKLNLICSNHLLGLLKNDIKFSDDVDELIKEIEVGSMGFGMYHLYLRVLQDPIVKQILADTGKSALIRFLDCKRNVMPFEEIRQCILEETLYCNEDFLEGVIMELDSQDTLVPAVRMDPDYRQNEWESEFGEEGLDPDLFLINSNSNKV